MSNIDWKPGETMPYEERVLLCYINMYGYNHVTEGYKEAGGIPTTCIGFEMVSPFLWAELPEGPPFYEFCEINGI